MKSDIRDYKDLVVWQKAYELCVEVYKATRDFPRSELYGMVLQLRRAAVSIPSNLAEGHTRQHTGEFIQFIYTALGSSSELETHLMISLELKYLKENEFENLSKRLIEIRKMLNGLINSLREKIRGK
ncbi:MAG: four helix bundle protein [Candidatus Margulisiibacteriota bacterium]